MDLHEKIKHINTKEAFIDFLKYLSVDKQNNSEQWENKKIDEYLSAIAAWTEDMEGYYYNMESEKPQNIDWKFIATLFYVGKIYE